MRMTTKSNPSSPSLPSLLASMLLWNQMKMMCKLPLLFFSSLCLFYFYSVCFCSLEITPPPTPSPVKAAGGKKCAIANNESDDDNFVPRYDKLSVLLYSKYRLFWYLPSHESPTRDSPKKARAKEPSTPSKGSKSVGRQLIFDAAVYVSALTSEFKRLTCIH